MNLTKTFNINGASVYNVKEGDVITVKVKNNDDLSFKIPTNFKGDLTVTISGQLTEITPTP